MCLAGRGRGRDAAEQAAAEAARQAAMLSHADLVASARKNEGPISIGGERSLTRCRAWVSLGNTKLALVGVLPITLKRS